MPLFQFLVVTNKPHSPAYELALQVLPLEMPQKAMYPEVYHRLLAHGLKFDQQSGQAPPTAANIDLASIRPPTLDQTKLIILKNPGNVALPAYEADNDNSLRRIFAKATSFAWMSNSELAKAARHKLCFFPARNVKQGLSGVAILTCMWISSRLVLQLVLTIRSARQLSRWTGSQYSDG